MSPARVDFGDLPTPEGSLYGGSLLSKTIAPRTGVADVDLVDDIRTLWETRWKYACQRQIHPFQDAHYEDFATIFSKLFTLGVTSAYEAAYTDVFYQLAQDLAEDAAQILLQHDSGDGPRLTSQQLLRACALLRVARFPHATDHDDNTKSTEREEVLALKKSAYALQKNLYVRAMRLWDVDGLAPLEEVQVPHVHDLATHPETGRHFDMGVRSLSSSSSSSSKGNLSHKGGHPRRPHIPMYVRVPLDTLLTGQQCPVLLILSADRTGETKRCEEALARGWAAVVVEVPGMGECPVPRRERGDDDDDEGHDAEARLWSSVLDWMKGMYFYDMDRVVAVGLGPTATRLAESHGSRLKGVVVHMDDHYQQQQQPISSNDSAEETTSVKCPVLIARKTPLGASKTTTIFSHSSKSYGLWTSSGAVQDSEVDENVMKLSEYRRETTGCVGQMRTSDMGIVYGWIEDVMESRETQIRDQPSSCCSSSTDLSWSCYPAGSRMLWWTEQWKPPSPPNSEAEKGLWFPRVHDTFA